MPNSATITSFFTFEADTKARAAHVNNNFDVFRGHFIPVHPDTITSSDITHDLGSDEHRWRTGFVQKVDFDRNTSTSSATIEADANTTASEMVFKINGTEASRITSRGIMRAATGFDPTAASGIGGFARSATITNGSFTSTGDTIFAGSTITLVSTGRPIRIGFVGQDIRFVSQTTTVTSLGGQMKYYVNNTLPAANTERRVDWFVPATTSNQSYYVPASAWEATLFLSAGTHTLHAVMAAAVSNILVDMTTNFFMYAYEL